MVSRMVRGRARAGLVALVVLLVCAAGAATARAAGYDVYVGYADGLRPNATNFPTPFDTGGGVTRVGDPSNAPGLDSGAIRLVNTTGVSETVNSVAVDIGPSHFALWNNMVLPAGGQLVLDETNGQNFDSSDAPSIGCTNDGLIPAVRVTVDGVATTYNDTGQVLNTRGIDPANCGGGNESQQWVSIGDQPCASGAQLTSSPATQTRQINTNATVNASFTACGKALTGATVDFTVVSGPNAGKTGSDTVDASGNAKFVYSSSHTGTDTVKVSVTNAGGEIDASPNVTVLWVNPPTLTGRAYAVSLGGLLTIKPTPDTGFVSTTQSSAVTPPCVADLAIPSSGSLVHAQTLCAAVFTDAPGQNSFGGASVASVTVAAPLLPAITVIGAQAKSKTTCAGSAGEVTVLGVKIGNVVLLPSPTKIAPNTTINVGVLKIVFNEQTKITSPDNGLIVNAVHITALGGAVNLVVASAESDISGCI